MIYGLGVECFLNFVWSQNCDHPQEDVEIMVIVYGIFSQSGYKPDMKVQNINQLSIFLATD